MNTRKILVLNGPNLNKLGTREPDVYGDTTLAELDQLVTEHGNLRGVAITCLQSNSESELVNAIHAAAHAYDGIVFNPGAYTHYSYVLRDAVACVPVPVVEVHLSDIDNREEFRKVSVIAPVCIGQVKGQGAKGYCAAVDMLCDAEEPEERPLTGDVLQDFTAPFAQEVASANVAQVVSRRGDAVREACRYRGLEGMLVRDTSNIRWITALDGVFDTERAHALLVTADGLQLHTDSRYSNAVRSAACRAGYDLLVDEQRVSHAQFAREALLALRPGDGGLKLGIEDTITYAEYLKMAETFDGNTLQPTSDMVVGLRAVKDESEIVRLKAAQAINDAAFSHIVKFMRPGMTEREVQLELEDYMVRHGAEGLAFSSIVAAGANGADPHAIPGKIRLQAGQCVVIDFGAKAFGYCSDMTRTVFLGKPQGTMLKAWETLRLANESVEEVLKPGMTGAQAHKLAEQVLEEGGFGGKMGHGLGHGVGIDIHELPVLSPRNQDPLEVGNVVTVEPGIYLPGEFGMRLEDCGVITAQGYEPFTQSTHDMVVI